VIERESKDDSPRGTTMTTLERVAQDGCADAHPIDACLRESNAWPGSAQTRDPGLPRELLRSALQYVDENLDSGLSWAQLAAAVGSNAFDFGRGFKLASGVTPHQYVMRRRVSRAMTLLEREELSIAEIALEVGCSCQSHFTTMFRKRTGTTPGAFRRAARERRRLADVAATRGPARQQREPIGGAGRNRLPAARQAEVQRVRPHPLEAR
jgi:AraC-like DNA-binding protein